MRIALRMMVLSAILVVGLNSSNFAGGGPVPTQLPPSPGTQL